MQWTTGRHQDSFGFILFTYTSPGLATILGFCDAMDDRGLYSFVGKGKEWVMQYNYAPNMPGLFLDYGRS
jgi:hypothetical protein